MTFVYDRVRIHVLRWWKRWDRPNLDLFIGVAPFKKRNFCHKIVQKCKIWAKPPFWENLESKIEIFSIYNRIYQKFALSLRKVATPCSAYVFQSTSKPLVSSSNLSFSMDKQHLRFVWIVLLYKATHRRLFYLHWLNIAWRSLILVMGRI